MVLIICKCCETEIDMPNRRFKMCSTCSRNKQLERCKNYKKNNREHVKEYNAIWKKENKDSVSTYNAKYNIENRKAIQDRQTKYQRERRKTDLSFKMSTVLRNRLRKFYTGERPDVKNLIGLSITDFTKWIESQFYSDMSWDNHGELWHVDHVVPCHWFNLLDETERKICFCWINMRPLYAKINMGRKNCTYKELLNQEIYAMNFRGKVNFKPLVTKLLEKSCNGVS